MFELNGCGGNFSFIQVISILQRKNLVGFKKKENLVICWWVLANIKQTQSNEKYL